MVIGFYQSSRDAAKEAAHVARVLDVRVHPWAPYGTSWFPVGRNAISSTGISGGYVVAATDTGVVMDEATVRAWLDEVPDPEIPVLTIMDLGVVRDVR